MPSLDSQYTHIYLNHQINMNVQHSQSYDPYLVLSSTTSTIYLESAARFLTGVSSTKGDSYTDIGVHVHTRFWSP